MTINPWLFLAVIIVLGNWLVIATSEIRMIKRRVDELERKLEEPKS